MIETVGLAAAIEAADVAVKAANIKIIGYELTKGNGMTTIKIEGSVGAVKAAIDAAVTSASKINKVWGKSVIPRRSNGLEMLIYSQDTVGLENNKEDIEDQEIQEDQEISIIEEDDIKEEKDIKEENLIEEDTELSEELDGCNLCKDPECPRKKGELRKMCIHYEEIKNEGRFNK